MLRILYKFFRVKCARIKYKRLLLKTLCANNKCYWKNRTMVNGFTSVCRNNAILNTFDYHLQKSDDSMCITFIILKHFLCFIFF